MSDSTDLPFAFEYSKFSFIDEGEFTLQPELRLLGRITRGRITRQLPIAIPTTHGPVIGVIVQFMDSLDDWLGLPFYDWLTVDSIRDGFCLCIVGIGPNIQPICPGTAHVWSRDGASG